MISEQLKEQIASMIKSAFVEMLPSDMPEEAKEQIVQKYNVLSNKLMLALVQCVTSATPKIKVSRNQIVSIAKGNTNESSYNEKRYLSLVDGYNVPTGAKVAITKKDIIELLSKGSSPAPTEIDGEIS